MAEGTSMVILREHLQTISKFSGSSSIFELTYKQLPTKIDAWDLYVLLRIRCLKSTDDLHSLSFLQLDFC